jgi:peptidoglycan/LPS O-acetylase OafA/YrhL
MQNTKRQLELDFVRGIAILMVLHFHFSTGDLFVRHLTVPLTNFGWAGVDLFFVLSGFLVGGLLLKEWKNSGSLRAIRFLKRRGFKIWPAYYFYFLVEVLVHKHRLSTFFWPNLLNYQNYVRTSLSQTWSLAIEEHFYLLLSAAIWWCSSKKVRTDRFLKGAMTVVLAVAMFRTFLAFTGHAYFFQTHTRIDALLLGVMLAALFHFYYDHFLKLQRRTLILTLGLGVSVIVLLIDPQFSENGIQILAADIGSASLFLLLYRPHAASHGRLYRIVAAIGVYSYGIYLWHLSVRLPVALILSHGPKEARYLRYPLDVLLALVLGYLMTKLIEFPFLRLRERFVPTVESYELSAGVNDVEHQITQGEGRPRPLFAPRS